MITLKTSQLRNLALAIVFGAVAAVAYATAPLTPIQTYGNEGFAIVITPSYAIVTINAPMIVWSTSTTDERALQRASSSGRVAAAWTADQSFTIDLDLTDGLPHRVSLYALDWDSKQRAERFDLYDAATSTLLDSRSITKFSGGVYVTWLITGHVRILVNRTGARGVVVSGLFIDPATYPSPSPTPSPTPTPCKILPNGKCQKN
jgi:hypothetical protein